MYNKVHYKKGVVKTRNAGISRNMAEYQGISRLSFLSNYHDTGTSQYFPIVANATVYKHERIKHERLTTYFITKVMYLSHFDGKLANNSSILEVFYVVYIIITSVHQQF
jgi:hypothetical protein